MYQVRDAERKLLLETEVLPYVRYDQKSQAWALNLLMYFYTFLYFSTHKV